MPLPDVEPTVVLVDASPLIHLAMLDALDLPLRFGPVVVPDAVEIETTHDRGKPFAAEIYAWLEARVRTPGANRWVERPSTEIGELLRIAVDMNRPRPRNVGEHAIVNWLADNVLARGGPALIVYENGKIPNMLIREGLAEDVIVVTSRTFLHLGHRAGHLADPDAAWATIAAADPRANPALNYQIILGCRP
ncbi:hypothetical protein [uncultured Methylobacterium sp.]|uniref:hypothetical protein n=1 Tax=uncultured Methylobacterium sp. TaxID=157278 RepID=UPI0035CB7428